MGWWDPADNFDVEKALKNILTFDVNISTHFIECLKCVEIQWLFNVEKSTVPAGNAKKDLGL